MKKTHSQINAFTIIELLVVIGIISILAVALLVSLNPAEAQKRARDAQRLKDINTLQSLMEQFINDGGSITGCALATPCTSNNVATVEVTSSSPQSCSTNWIGLNFCTWAKTIPVDPTNDDARTCVTGVTTGVQTGCVMRYRAIFSGSNYEFSTMLESTTNAGKTNEGGVNDTNGGTNKALLQIWSGGELTAATFRTGTAFASGSSTAE